MSVAALPAPWRPAVAPHRWAAPALGVALAGVALLPPEAGTLAALAAIIGLGVPHGALDGEVARGALRPRVGRGWFALFAPPYLATSALVLAAWHVAPLTTLALFLAVSVWHFGAEDAGPGSALALVPRGGLPVAVPVLVQPHATAALLGGFAGVPLPAIPPWLDAASLAWLVAALAWAATLLRDGRGRDLAVPGAVAVCAAVLPPLVGFAIYFVCVHAPAHTAALIADRSRAPRVRDRRSAVLLALPLTGLTLLLGAALWPFYAGPPAGRLLTLTFQGLAALTLPHVLLDLGLTRLCPAGQGSPRGG